MGKIKQQRTAEHIKIIVSKLLRLEMDDPRVQGITVTGVSIDRELQHADIRVNALGDEEREKEVMEGLESAKPYIRRQLGQSIRLRKLPQLHFHWDHSLQHVVEINELLDNLHIPPSEDDDEKTE